MAELKWKTPVPKLGFAQNERGYIERLIRWLGEQEREADFDLDSILAFGGLGVAERIFGFEGLISPTPPDTTEILSAPIGAQKKIVIGLHVYQAGSAGTYNVVKNKGGTISIILSIDSSVLDHEEVVGRHKTGYITLDSVDENLEIRTLATANDISYSGSYVLVD